MIKAVIFDMDGLFIDSEPLHMKAWNRIANKYGVNFTESQYSYYVGSDAVELADTIIDQGKVKGKSAREIHDEKREVLGEIAKEASIREGAGDLAEKLKKKYKLGIASSSSTKTVELFLKATNAKDLFESIVGAEDVRKIKPAPDIYLLTAKNLRVRPEECIAIEDSSTGCQSAKNAGMKVIAVPNKYTENQDFSMADYREKSFDKVCSRIV